MSKLMTSLNSVLLLSAAGLLAACGGGGGGGGDSAGSDVAAASADTVVISSANAPQVAGAAYNASVALEGASLGGTGFLTGVVTAAPGGGVDMVEVILAQVNASQTLFADNPATFATGAVVTASETCTNGGSFDFTLNDADDNQELSTGDSLSASFSSCSKDGAVLNGSISISNVIITGDPQSFPYSLQFTVQANDFTVIANGEATSLHGTLTLSQSTGDGLSITTSISGTSIALAEAGGSATLSAFLVSSTENPSTGYTFDINATVSSPEIDGTVTIVTNSTFQGVVPDAPFTGQATVTGANHSRLTLIVIDAVNVTLLVDEDGDGVTDTTIDTTWDNL